MAATAKAIELKGKGKTILKGNKSKPESAEHIVYFPGGSISVARTSDDQYWAHISISKENLGDSGGVMDSKAGKIEVIRIDTVAGVKEIDHMNTDHFAILISTK